MLWRWGLVCLFIGTSRPARRWFAWRGAWSGCSMRSCLIWMRAGRFTTARLRRTRVALLRWLGLECVHARGSTGFRFLWGLVIRWWCWRVVLFWRLRMGVCSGEVTAIFDYMGGDWGSGRLFCYLWAIITRCSVSY